MIPSLEQALFQWLCHQNYKNVAIIGVVIKLYPGRSRSDTNTSICTVNKIELKFFKGRLKRFRKCYKLKCRRVHGESLSADQVAIDKELPRLKRILATYALKDVWNAG